MARSAVSSSRVGYYDPKWMAKNLAPIKLASAAKQNVLCFATICDDYPRFAEEWPDEYLGNRGIQLDTVTSEERDGLFGFGHIIEHIR